MKPAPLERVEALVDRYRCFVFDQYGVLHDGQRAYRGMGETLDAIKAAGATVVVLTNSGRRAAPNAERLAGFGYGAARVDHVVSSGELAYRLLSGQIDSDARRDRSMAATWKLDAGSRVLLLARGDDRSAIDGLPGRPTGEPADATHVLIAGSEGERRSLDDYRAILEPAVARGVPALCTNPDRWMLVGRNRRCFAAGQIAETYAELGGSVLYVGKPWPAIYRFLLAEAGATAGETVCIGDSIEHDIRGAAKAGCASVLVATGIHADADAVQRRALYERYAATPDFLLAG